MIIWARKFPTADKMPLWTERQSENKGSPPRVSLFLWGAGAGRAALRSLDGWWNRSSSQQFQNPAQPHTNTMLVTTHECHQGIGLKRQQFVVWTHGYTYDETAQMNTQYTKNGREI